MPGLSLGVGASLTPRRKVNFYSSSNLLTRSRELEHADWGSVAGVVSDAGIAPNGTASADSLAGVVIGQSGKTVMPGSQTLSVFAKRIAGTNWLLLRANGFDSDSRAWINLATGSLGAVSGTGATHSIISFGNGWYRCSLHWATSTDLTGGITMGVVGANSTITASGLGSDVFLLWEAALVSGA